MLKLKELIIDMSFLTTAFSIARLSNHAVEVKLDFVVLFIIFIGLKIVLLFLEHIEEKW